MTDFQAGRRRTTSRCAARSASSSAQAERILAASPATCTSRRSTGSRSRSPLEWAILPGRAQPAGGGAAAGVVRRVRPLPAGVRPGTEIPPPGLLHSPGPARRPLPVFSDADIAALMDRRRETGPPLRAATYQTLIGLAGRHRDAGGRGDRPRPTATSTRGQAADRDPRRQVRQVPPAGRSTRPPPKRWPAMRRLRRQHCPQPAPARSSCRRGAPGCTTRTSRPAVPATGRTGRPGQPRTAAPPGSRPAAHLRGHHPGPLARRRHRRRSRGCRPCRPTSGTSTPPGPTGTCPAAPELLGQAARRLEISSEETRS